VQCDTGKQMQRCPFIKICTSVHADQPTKQDLLVCSAIQENRCKGVPSSTFAQAFTQTNPQNRTCLCAVRYRKTDTKVSLRQNLHKHSRRPTHKTGPACVQCNTGKQMQRCPFIKICTSVHAKPNPQNRTCLCARGERMITKKRSKVSTNKAALSLTWKGLACARCASNK